MWCGKSVGMPVAFQGFAVPHDGKKTSEKLQIFTTASISKVGKNNLLRASDIKKIADTALLGIYAFGDIVNSHPIASTYLSNVLSVGLCFCAVPFSILLMDC